VFWGFISYLGKPSLQVQENNGFSWWWVLVLCSEPSNSWFSRILFFMVQIFNLSLWEIRSPVQTQRMDSETHGVQTRGSETLMASSIRMGAWRAETPEAVTISIILPSVQVPPPLSLSTMGCTFFFQGPCLIPIGLFKICLLGLVKF
jgi:hypothetical protein